MALVGTCARRGSSQTALSPRRAGGLPSLNSQRPHPLENRPRPTERDSAGDGSVQSHIAARAQLQLPDCRPSGSYRIAARIEMQLRPPLGVAESFGLLTTNET